MKMPVSWRSAVPLLAVLCTVAADCNVDNIVGGITPANFSSPDVQKALKFAVFQYNKKNKFASKVCKEIDAKQQVVAGINYFFIVEMGRTTCRNERGVYVDQCTGNKVGMIHTCYFRVWSRPWLKPGMSLTKSVCLY